MRPAFIGSALGAGVTWALVVLGILAPYLRACSDELVWPITDGGEKIKGTYGDYRGTVFHKGVDFYSPVGSEVWAVKDSLTLTMEPYYDPLYRGWNYEVQDEYGNRFLYGHVQNECEGHGYHYGYELGGPKPAAADTIFDFGLDSLTANDHVEVDVITGAYPTHEGECNPLSDSCRDYFPDWQVDGSPPEHPISWGYMSPDVSFASPFYYFDCLLNQYHPYNFVPCCSSFGVDVVVYASDDGMRSGVAELYCTWSASGWEPGDDEWQHKMTFLDSLPSDGSVTKVYDYVEQPSIPEDYVVYPQTNVGGGYTNADSLWYVITNFDSEGNYVPSNSLCVGDSVGYLHVKAVDAVGNTKWIYFEIHCNCNPTEEDTVPSDHSVTVWTTVAMRTVEITWRVQGAELDCLRSRLERKGPKDEEFRAIHGSERACSPSTESHHFSDRVGGSGPYVYVVSLEHTDGQWEKWAPSEVLVPFVPLKEGRLLVAKPNPFEKGTTIRGMSLGQHWNRASIFDVRGRLVRELTGICCGSGSCEVSWDGCDDAGSRVSSGVYFVRVEGRERSEAVKLVLTR